MKLLTTASLLVCLATAGLIGTASAQTAQAPASQSAAATLTSESTIGELMDDPRALPVFLKHFKEVAESENIEMAKNMSPRSLKAYAPDKFTDAKLDQFDAELKKAMAAPAPKQK